MDEEFFGARLYTGPLYVKYNIALRHEGIVNRQVCHVGAEMERSSSAVGTFTTEIAALPNRNCRHDGDFSRPLRSHTLVSLRDAAPREELAHAPP